MKKFLTAMLSVCAVGVLGLAACNNGKNPDDSTPAPLDPIKYTFQVKANAGVQLSESGLKIVIYGQDGSIIETLLLGDDGKRTKTLTPDTYTVCLENEEGEKIYTTTTPLTNDSDITLYALDQPTDGTGEDQEQYQIANGYYGVPLNKYNHTFFAFTPTKVGTYRITSYGTADVAYAEYDASEEYLNPAPIATEDDNGEDVNFVYEFDVNPTEFNSMGSSGDYKIYFSVGFSDKATDTSATNSVIFIEYVNGQYTEDAAPEYTTQVVTLTKADDVLYGTDGSIAKFGSQSGSLTPLPYNATLVYNESDRYYHIGTENGPLAVMPFTVVPERLLDQPFNKIANPDPNDPSDNANPATLHLTFTDDEAKTITVKEYNKLINEIYPSAVNDDGVYPLTEEMREFLYQFVVVAKNDINVQNIPKELRWKAPLYYYETGTIEDDKPNVSDWTGNAPNGGDGSKENPFIIGTGDYCAPFGSVSGIVYYLYTAKNAGYLTISSEDEKAVITFVNENITVNGDVVSSTSESGEVLGKGEYSFESNVNDKLLIQVCTNDWNSAKVEFSLTYSAEKPVDTSLGSASNPYILQTGETTAKSEGKTFIWYAFTPTEGGSYTFTNENNNATIAVYTKPQAGIANEIKKHAGNGSFTVTLEAGTTYYVWVAEGVNDYFTIVFSCVKA